MSTVERIMPPNLFSLSQQERTAFSAIGQQTVAAFDSIDADIDALATRLRYFATIAERDAFYTTPEYGDLALVRGGKESTTLWTYTPYTTDSFNSEDAWLPFDFQWQYYDITSGSSNITVGSGTLIGRYKRSGAVCNVEAEFTLGAGSAVAANPTFGLPFQGSAGAAMGNFIGGGHTFGDVFLKDANSTDYFGCTVITATPFNAFIVQSLRTDLTHLSGASVNSTAPFTWASGDAITLSRTHYTMDIKNIVPFTE